MDYKRANPFKIYDKETSIFASVQSENAQNTEAYGISFARAMGLRVSKTSARKKEPARQKPICPANAPCKAFV